MTVVPSKDIAARRRPIAVLSVFLFQLAWGLVVAAPAHGWARRVWGNHPAGDAVLWAPGGRELMTWLGGLDPALSVTTRTSMLLVFAGMILSQIPIATLLVSLVTEREDTRAIPLRTAFGRGASLFLPMLVVHFAVGAVSVLILGVGVAMAAALDAALVASIGDARAFKVAVAVAGLAYVIACVWGVFGDLVRAALAYDDAEGHEANAWSRTWSAARRAGRAARRGFAVIFGEWAYRAIAGLVLVIVGSWFADLLGGRGGAALVALWLAHQGVVLARTALRASFLARALRAVSRAPATAETPPIATAAP